MPESWDFVQAAATPEVFLTAYDAFVQPWQLENGRKCVGSWGPVAELARQPFNWPIRWERSYLGLPGFGRKLAGAAALGMDVGINYREQVFFAVVNEVTSGIGVDVLVDFIGGPYWDQNIASMATQGRLVEVGLMGGGRVEIDMGQLLWKRLQVTGTTLGGPVDRRETVCNRPIQASRLASPGIGEK
ncbi:MAG: hypothetical protein Ct9H300mP11_03450 [Chloroflexota bacterium]|nr:MAG: hypothetical protein Ct9H300mP11_03450 [Chloroflexota bacterium]